MRDVSKRNSNRLIVGSVTTQLGNAVFDYVNQMLITQLFPKKFAFMSYYQSSESLISVVFNLFAGVVADASNRKRMLIITDVLSGVVCLLSILFLKSEAVFLGLIVANGLLRLLSTFNSPVYSAIIKDSIDKTYIDNHYTRSTPVKEVFKIIAPSIGVLVWKYMGLTGAYLFNALTFFISAYIENRIEVIRVHKAKQIRTLKIILQDMLEGFRYILKHHKILLLLIMSSAINFLLASYNLAIPYLNSYYKETMDNYFGAILIASSVGSISFSLLKNQFPTAFRNLTMYGSMIGVGLSLIFLTAINKLTTNPFVNLAPFIMFSGFLTLFNIDFFSNVQKSVDSDYIGRVISVIFTIAIIFMPIGSLVFGRVITLNNLMLSFGITGMGIIIISVVFRLIAIKLDKEKF